MKILITGANGMVARAANAHCTSIGDEVAAMARADLDIADREAVFSTFEEYRFDAVLNCAAYTDVDGAESNYDASYAANAAGVENLALASREFGSRFVTISTDYVFDGSNDGFYTQRDTPEPQGVYAMSKLDGEMRARYANSAAVVVRSGWIFGHGGTNFLSVMHKLLSDGKAITAISDAFGTPTYAGDLARRLRELAELDMPCTFHVTNSGDGTSYLGFAEAVCRNGGYDPGLVRAVVGGDLKRPAPRPVSSKLACLFSDKFGLEPLPYWEDSLKAFITEKA